MVEIKLDEDENNINEEIRLDESQASRDESIDII